MEKRSFQPEKSIPLVKLVRTGAINLREPNLTTKVSKKSSGAKRPSAHLDTNKIKSESKRASLQR